MRCQEARALIYTYIDGCLAGQVERAFFGHLSQCKNCRQELEYARQTHALLEKYCTPVEPPADFLDQVMAAIDGIVPEETAPVQEPKQVVPEQMSRQKAKEKSFTWSFRRLAQVASLVFLSGAVWFGTMLNGGFQLARTPDLGINPETGYEQPQQQEKQPSAQETGVAVQPGNDEAKRPQPSHEESITTPPEAADNGDVTEINRQDNQPVSETENNQKAVEQPEPPVEEVTPQPVQVAQVKPPELPVADPEIMEPTGVFRAAGIENGETLSSISLQRLAFGDETQHLNGVFTGNKVRYLDGKLGNQLTIWEAGSSGEQPGPLGKTGKAVAASPVWSNDGKRLAYLHQNKLYIDDLAGGAVEVAPAAASGEIKYPVWSGKGELAYLLIDGTANHVVVSNGQDSPVVASTDYTGGLAWSPDGSSIAFGKNGQLYTVSRDGSQEKAVTKLEGQLQGIDWSSTGNIAASVKGTHSQQGLWVGGADGSNWQRVAETAGGRELKWSPDGRKVAFTDAQGMAYVLTFTQDGQRDKLYAVTPEKGNGGARNMAWSANSSQLLLEWAPTGEPTAIWKASLP